LMARKAKKTVAKKSSATKARAAKKSKRVAWSSANEKELRSHSKSKTSVERISKLMKRTPGALRQKARSLGIPLGHRR